MQKEQKIALRTGIFVLLALTGFSLMIFTVGSKRGYFKEKFTLKTTFSNVQGLWIGSPVRLAGVNVGKVTGINFPKDLATKKIEVSLEIDETARERIRGDSAASIKWLSYVTGDSYIELTIGSHNEPEVEDGDYLNSIEPIDYALVFEDGIKMLDIVKKNFSNLEAEGFFGSLSRLTGLLKEGAEEVKTGHGILHALVYEPAGDKLIHNLVESSESFKNAMLEIEKGAGSAHQLIYGAEIKDLLSNFSKISQDTHEIIDNIKNSEGLLHSLLYDKEHGNIIADMSLASSNLKEFVTRINRGEGSLGAIINDPTLYEDIKSLLGGAEQSFVLKKLIRHSLKKGRATNSSTP